MWYSTKIETLHETTETKVMGDGDKHETPGEENDQPKEERQSSESDELKKK